MEKLRSLRSFLTTKIKDTLFSVFGEGLLEPITNKATPEMILEWKKSEKTRACYKKLFDKINNTKDTYMERILEKIWPSGDASEEKIAYAIAVCQTVLNPKNKILTMSEDIIKPLIAKNLVSTFCNFFFL